MSSSSESATFDASRRRLCPDGACVGLLDESGRCKECGLTASGEAGAADLVPFPPAADDAESAESADEGGSEEMAPGAAEPVESGGFDPRRKLCPDGACVGVLGADGRCKVCGQAG
jgi:hypothetical protein